MLMLHQAAREDNIYNALTLMGFICKEHPDSNILVTARFAKMLEEVDFDFLLDPEKR